MFKHKKSPSLLDTTRNSLLDRQSLPTNDMSMNKKLPTSPTNIKKIRTPSTVIEPLSRSNRKSFQHSNQETVDELIQINIQISELQKRKSYLLSTLDKNEYSHVPKAIRYNKDYNNQVFNKYTVIQMEKNWMHYHGQMNKDYKFNGKGVLYYRNAKVFGYFKDGNLEGRATIFSSDNKISVGSYKQGILQQMEYQ